MPADEPAAASIAPPSPHRRTCPVRRQDHSSWITRADQPAKPDARQSAGTNREAVTRHLPRSVTSCLIPATDRRLRAASQPCRQFTCIRTDDPVMRGAESLDHIPIPQARPRASAWPGSVAVRIAVVAGVLPGPRSGVSGLFPSILRPAGMNSAPALFGPHRHAEAKPSSSLALSCLCLSCRNPGRSHPSRRF
jgi:hypothetical protein